MSDFWKAAAAGVLAEIAVFAFLEESMRVGAVSPLMGCAAMLVLGIVIAVPIAIYLRTRPKQLILLALLLTIAAPVLLLASILIVNRL